MISSHSNYYCSHCKKRTNHVAILPNSLIICGLCKYAIVGQENGIHRIGIDQHRCTRCDVTFGGRQCHGCALRMPEGELFYGTWHITYDPLNNLMAGEDSRGTS